MSAYCSKLHQTIIYIFFTIS